jgi:Raf kinase inhibitor-like YbhB/YbcL family protein
MTLKENPMKLTSTSFNEGDKIPGDFSFCTPDPAHHVCLGKNLNPQLSWSGKPAETRSFALICHDPDVPSQGDDVNQEGRSVPASLPRVDFFHWVLIDLPATMDEIGQGEFSDEVTPRGKPGPATLHGARQGINDYTGWFAGDNDMRGDYYGYDGPCPPWNDEVRHRYVFTLFALDVDALPLDGKFTGQHVREAMKGHILDQASLTGTYWLNPAITP